MCRISPVSFRVSPPWKFARRPSTLLPRATRGGSDSYPPQFDGRPHLVDADVTKRLRKAPQTRHTLSQEATATTEQEAYLIELPSSPTPTRPTKSRKKTTTTTTRNDGDDEETDLIDIRARTVSTSSSSSIQKSSSSSSSSMVAANGPILMITKPLPRVLLLHTGGTLGMDPDSSFTTDTQTGSMMLKKGTGGQYNKSLQPGKMLANIKAVVPELSAFANLDLKVVMNVDSCRVGPAEWIKLAQILHENRDFYDAFLVVHGTDTLSFTASALSLMLLGFRKPIVMTGSQLPLTMPRSDARQNLIDSLTCATAAHVPPHVHLQEVCICFGGRLLRGNRAQKVNSSAYQAFDSPSYPHLAVLGVDIEWKEQNLLRDRGVYRPRFKLNPNVIRVPIVPGCDPRQAYGDLVSRGVKGIVLEAFGVGNMPDAADAGWLPWLKDQRRKGLQIYLSSQCTSGPLNPGLYRSGSRALELGVVDSGLAPMTAECAVVKMMMTIAYPDIPLGVPLAGEL